MRVLFTGGSGKAGKYVLPYLINSGHRVLNVDRTPFAYPGIDNISADVTDAGQMFTLMSSYSNFAELEPGAGCQKFDAVVHFAAIPRILIKPDNETFRINVQGTYNVIEAAIKSGIRKVIIASSETVYGVCFADGKINPEKFPLDESYDVNPMDAYGLSKVVNEKTARAFQRRSGADIYALRISNVLEPTDYQRFSEILRDTDQRRRDLFGCIDARDLGQIVDKCLLKDDLGFQIFNATSNTNMTTMPTREIIEKFYKGVPVDESLGEYQGLSSNKKACSMLEFEEKHNWRKYV